MNWNTRRRRFHARASSLPFMRWLSPKPPRLDEPGHRLFSALTADLGVVRFIQIGSNDAQFGDPLRPFLRTGLWHGLLVEPVPEIYQRLCDVWATIPSVRPVPMAVSETVGQRIFYSLRPATSEEKEFLPAWYDQIGSFDRATVLTSATQIKDLESRIVPIEVSCVTYDALCALYDMTDIDLVHIDTEGHDGRIVSSMNLRGRPPKLLIFEHKHLIAVEYEGLIRHIESCGYTWIRWTDDVVCLHKSMWLLLAPRTRQAWNEMRRRARAHIS